MDYFIAYRSETDDTYGYGNAVLTDTTNDPSEDTVGFLNEVEEFLEKEYGLTKAIVMNYKRAY